MAEKPEQIKTKGYGKEMQEISPPPKFLNKYAMIFKVVDSQGKCPIHKIGDEFEWTFDTENFKPLPMCPQAIAAMWSKIWAMMNGAKYPPSAWGRAHPDKAYWCCPDADNVVVWELHRVPIKKEER